MIKVMSNTFDFRVEMVRLYARYGLSKAADICGVSRVTVLKWVKRHREYGLKGLKDRSRRPHHSPGRLCPEIREQIIRLRRRWPVLSPARMILEFKVSADIKTIYKVLHEEGLMPRRRVKKRQRQRDLRKWKEAHFAPLSYWQVDTKDCVDIPYYLERIRSHHFPRYLYQARDVRTGVLFSAYAQENTVTNATRFITVLMEHLRACGLQTDTLTVQTDNGSEYVPLNRSLKQSAFTKKIAGYGAQHVRIPPGEKTWQSEVERANGIIQDELLAYERWETEKELTAKTTAWEYYFNRLRKNTYHQNQAPYQRMLKAGVPSQIANRLCLWSVPVVDSFVSRKLNDVISKSVNHVPPIVTLLSKTI